MQEHERESPSFSLLNFIKGQVLPLLHTKEGADFTSPLSSVIVQSPRGTTVWQRSLSFKGRAWSQAALYPYRFQLIKV